MKEYVSLFMAMTLFFACSDNFPNDTPACISGKINAEKNDYCQNAKVEKYMFNGREVYVFDTQNCFADGGSEILEADCTNVCFIGGIGGIMDCEGINFNDNAAFVELIWQN